MPPNRRESSADAGGHHPPGLYYLAFTEAWERLSYYGEQLLTPGHAEKVVGLAALRSLFELRGRRSALPEASRFC